MRLRTLIINRLLITLKDIQSHLMKEKLKQRFPKPGCVAPAFWDNDSSNEDFQKVLQRSGETLGLFLSFKNMVG